MASAYTPGSVICRDAACQHAVSHVSLCECPCGGSGHGSVHAPGRARSEAVLATRYVQPGFTAAMLAAVGDEDSF